MRRVILISGKQGAGKSRLAKSLVKELGTNNLILSFADPLRALVGRIKLAAEELDIIDSATEVEGRELMQFIGTDWLRKQEPDVWVRLAKSRIKDFPKVKYVIFDDVRFKNEFDMQMDDVAFFKIRLECGEPVRQLRAKYFGNPSHKSETELDNEKFDLVIDTYDKPDVVTAKALHAILKWSHDVC